MRTTLIQLLEGRLDSEIAPQSPLKFLKRFPVESWVDQAIATVYMYTRPRKGHQKNAIYLAELIAALGHGLRGYLKQKRDSSVAAKTGAFVLFSFEQLGLLEVVLGAGSKGHASYIVRILEDELICSLWESVESSKIDKLPAFTPYEPWTSWKHPTGATLVKTGNKEVLERLTPERCPMVFECVNRAQAQGWRIDSEILKTYEWALRNRTNVFSDIWEQQKPEARTTKLREARAIGEIAKRMAGSTFYHLYYLDFRGRKYPASAYLHEQGSDLARGLLKRADSKPISGDGFRWLLISLASNWAGDAGREDGRKTDKIPLNDRAAWVLDNEEIFLSYAESPKVHQGWMDADKPWQFLSNCVELRRFREWQMSHFNDWVPPDEIDVKLERLGVDPYAYESSLECYIDGSNNGSQHLSALTRDEVTAPHVNLVKSKLPGDLYKYVADHVWASIRKTVEEEYPAGLVGECNVFIDTLMDYKKRIMEAPPKSEMRESLVQQINEFKERNSEIATLAAPVYWLRVSDPKQQRSIVKRNVMTLPYGGTAYGLGQQQIDDAKKHGIALLMYLEHRWGSYMGREVFEDCRVSLYRPMRLLSVFEQAGKLAESEGRFLSWTVPKTNFPVIQYYTEGTTKKIWVQYGPPRGKRLSTGYYENTLQLSICFIEDTKPSKNKQSQGASPNAIHSLDAAHLTMTVNACDFPVTTIHDSFGCLLADMPKLYRIVREQFVELYRENPLYALMEEIRGDISNLKLGDLDINEVLESEYCFS